MTLTNKKWEPQFLFVQNEAADRVSTFFRTMIVDRSSMETSRKLGCLFVIVHLFKLYFRVSICVERRSFQLLIVVNDELFDERCVHCIWVSQFLSGNPS